ncbi:uncharacterized protein LOC126670369 [Mercurialis annua]|uniref:uncharacterized protein LOC126670369 n=1 Tax=Mercurialis annua TaxID=3986 RepID=UPI00215E5689|nr:uncharacterized protein LOC126670369 [Mercurialis annua]
MSFNILALSPKLLLCKFSRPSPKTPFPYNPIIKRYSESNGQTDGHGVEERAPSTADEFKRVAEEKAKSDETADDQQTIATDHSRESAEAVEQRSKKHDEPADADSRKKG